MRHGSLVDVSPLTESRTLTENFVQSVESSREFLFRRAANSRAEAIDGARSDLTDLDPGAFCQTGRLALEGQGKSRSGFLAGQRQGDDTTGSIVEDIVTQNQDRASAGIAM